MVRGSSNYVYTDEQAQVCKEKHLTTTEYMWGRTICTCLCGWVRWEQGLYATRPRQEATSHWVQMDAIRFDIERGESQARYAAERKAREVLEYFEMNP